MIVITPTIGIEESEVQEEFIRASGPGGQNVNKVSTAVRLRFDVRNSPSLPYEVKDRLAKIAGSRLTEDGILLITSQRYRTQVQNREDALAQFVSLLKRATYKPKPHIATKPTYGSKQRRLESKRLRSKQKQNRRYRPSGDE